MYTRTYCGHIGRGRANVMYEYAVGASGDTGAPEPSGAGAFLEMLCAERAFHLRCFGCLQRVVVVWQRWYFINIYRVGAGVFAHTAPSILGPRGGSV